MRLTQSLERYNWPILARLRSLAAVEDLTCNGLSPELCRVFLFYRMTSAQHSRMLSALKSRVTLSILVRRKMASLGLPHSAISPFHIEVSGTIGWPRKR